MRGRVLVADTRPDPGMDRCVAAQRPRHMVDPMLALTILGIQYPFPRDLERQAPVVDDVGCQHTHVMAPLIEVARELAYPHGSDDI